MINYHFFGRDCFIDNNLNERNDLNLKLRALEFKLNEVMIVNQVHGSEVILIDNPSKILPTFNLPKADGIVTNLKNLPLGIVTADCAPVVFFDVQNSIIGACHAGWRGAKLGIIEATVKKMRAIGAEEITAIIGPTIQQYSYEVSQDFYDDFLTTDKNYLKFFKKHKNDAKNQPKWLFDLPSFVAEKLLQAKVDNIENLAIDTYTNPAKYFSYRYSRFTNESDSGRNVSVISINE